jgi:hypothetical protein
LSFFRLGLRYPLFISSRFFDWSFSPRGSGDFLPGYLRGSFSLGFS